MARKMSTVAVRQTSRETVCGGFHPVVAGMQDEAAAAVHRAAVAHDEIARMAGQADDLLLVHDAELHQQVRKQHLLGLVDDEAHGAFRGMGADIDHRAREPVVLHAGHGDEELVVEEAVLSASFLLRRNPWPEPIAFGGAMKDGSAAISMRAGRQVTQI